MSNENETNEVESGSVDWQKVYKRTGKGTDAKHYECNRRAPFPPTLDTEPVKWLLGLPKHMAQTVVVLGIRSAVLAIQQETHRLLTAGTNVKEPSFAETRAYLATHQHEDGVFDQCEDVVACLDLARSILMTATKVNSTPLDAAAVVTAKAETKARNAFMTSYSERWGGVLGTADQTDSDDDEG